MHYSYWQFPNQHKMFSWEWFSYQKKSLNVKKPMACTTEVSLGNQLDVYTLLTYESTKQVDSLFHWKKKNQTVSKKKLNKWFLLLLFTEKKTGVNLSLSVSRVWCKYIRYIKCFSCYFCHAGFQRVAYTRQEFIKRNKEQA